MTKPKIALLIVLLFTTRVLIAAMPSSVNFQGKLTDTGGAPVDTVVSMTFKLYDEVGGGAVWTETHPAVPVEDGHYDVLLGSINPLSASVADLFSIDGGALGITLGTDSELSPQSPLSSVFSAFRVHSVDGATGGTVTGDLKVNGRGNFGVGNTNTGVLSFVAGESNAASGDRSVVGGGAFNRARGSYSVVAGGGGESPSDSNSASGNYSAIGGGRSNTATWPYSTIAGGYSNAASSSGTTIGGGTGNIASGAGSTISGGESNTAPDTYGTVSGGISNSASGERSTVCGGSDNVAAGAYSTVCGGGGNYAADGSFACGIMARAYHPFSFVFGSLGSDSTRSFADYSFSARCIGGARFYTWLDDSTGVSLPAGGGAWSTLSDKNQKRLHGVVNTSDVLQKVTSLPLHRWSYRTQDERIQHVGPTAQDFHAAFGLGDNNTTISTIDPDGVLFAAVQELAKRSQEQQKLIQRLQAEIQSLRADRDQTINMKQ